MSKSSKNPHIEAQPTEQVEESRRRLEEAGQVGGAAHSISQESAERGKPEERKVSPRSQEKPEETARGVATLHARMGRWRYYGLALLLVAIGGMMRMVLTRLAGPGIPTYITFYPLVMLAALMGGWGPGLLATLATAVVAGYWLLPPPGLFKIGSTTDVVGLVFFCVMGIFVSVVAELYRRTRDHLDELVVVRTTALSQANEQLQQKVAERRRAEGAVQEANQRLRAQSEELQSKAEELRANESHLAEAQQIAHLGSWSWDPVADRLYWSDEIYRIYGLQPGELVPRHNDFLRFVHPEDRQRVEKFVREALGHERYSTEFRIVQKGGEERYVHSEGATAFDEEGHPLKMEGIIEDITERKRAEEVLRVKDSAIASSLNAIAIADLQGRLTYVNSAYLRLWGYENEQEVLGKSVLDFWEEPQRAMQVMQAIQNGGGWVGELVAVRKDGTHLNLYLSASTVLNDDGTPICMMASFVDITDRKRAEEALRRSEEQFHRLFEDDLTGNFIGTPEGQILLCNPAFATIFGFARAQDAVGTSIVDLYLDPQERPPLVERLKKEGKLERLEVWGKRRDAEPIHIVGNLVGHFNEQGELYEIKGYLLDDTERKRAEYELQEAHQRLNLHIDNAPLAVVEWDSDFHITRWAGEAARVFGWTSAEVLGKRADELPWVYEQDLPRVQQAMADMFSGRRPRNVIKNRNIRKDGTIISCEWYNSAISDASGRLVSVLSQVLDVTERQRAEEALRASEARLKATLHSIQDEVWIVDAEGRIVLINEAVEGHLGVNPGRWQDIYAALAELEIFLPNGTPRPAEQAPLVRSLRGEVLTGEQEIIRNLATGVLRWREVTSAPIRDQAGRTAGAVVVARDITERKRAEEALREWNTTLESKVAERTAQLEHRARQLQKLTLEISETEDRERKRMAEILHDDLQQQLAAAKFHVGLLRSRARYDALLQDTAAQIDHMLKDAIEKSRNLSHELSPAVMHHADLEETFRWLAGQVQAKHGLVVHVDAQSGVRSESEALNSFLYKAAQEFLFNVVKHAQVHEVRLRVRRLGRCLCLSVSDRGRGFDPQGLQKTAGFGLLNIRERVELLGGRMKIRSAPDQGSTFSLVVPDGATPEDPGQKTKDGGALREPSSVLRPASAGARLRVLLADDHEIVRQGLRALLGDEHDVEVVGEAANGREAVDLASRLKPDVIIMDVSMPLIEGDEATRQIKAYLPRTRVIAISMYDQAEKREAMSRAGAERYVLKTAPSEELLAAIRGQEVTSGRR